ncbi:MAG: DUF4434 domain-containing protein [Eubacteriales bacterium]|nr:DUF4434 domain-containing protein [Eubacteriales bacterium]
MKSKEFCFSIIPAVRVTTLVRPEIRLYTETADAVRINIRKGDKELKKYIFALEKGVVRIVGIDLSFTAGDIFLDFNFMAGENTVFRESYAYQVVDTSLPSTTLMDGCWISIYHWSEDEARFFNKALKTMKDEDFKDHIRAMKPVGINGIIIQSVFDNNAYANCHRMEESGYTGKAFYPSKLYPGRIELSADDPVEAVLSAADECGMHVFVGVGLYAWFDFSPASLKWHKAVATELFEMYGHHKSFYGWYISEEIFGALYAEWDKVPYEKYKDIADFFREFKAFAKTLAPTKPVALAPNNINFTHYEKEWQTILPNVDILIPFAFARDLEHLNVTEIKRICEECATHMWVDMEVFKNPFPDGLIPKETDELIKEIRIYDDVEQIYGYQFTGMLNPPESPFDLGGEPAKCLYEGYRKYYEDFMKKQNANGKPGDI